MQVAQLAKAALDVRHMDLNVILEATEESKETREKASCHNRFLQADKLSRATAAGFLFT